MTYKEQAFNEKVIAFASLDEILSKRTPEDRAKIIAEGDKLAAKRDATVGQASSSTEMPTPCALSSEI